LPLSSIVSQSIFIFLPGRQPLQFYLCSNQINEEVDALPHKVNLPSTLLLIGSINLHMLVSWKIRRFKAKQLTSVLPMQQSEQARLNDISLVEKRSLSDVVTNLFTIAGTIVLVASLAITNWPKPSFFTSVIH